MKRNVRGWLKAAAVVGLLAAAVGPASAATFTSLWRFSGTNGTYENNGRRIRIWTDVATKASDRTVVYRDNAGVFEWRAEQQCWNGEFQLAGLWRSSTESWTGWCGTAAQGGTASGRGWLRF